MIESKNQSSYLYGMSTGMTTHSIHPIYSKILFFMTILATTGDVLKIYFNDIDICCYSVDKQTTSYQQILIIGTDWIDF